MQHLIRLPHPRAVQQRVRALALLDALLLPDVRTRSFNYRSGWNDDEDLAFMYTPDHAKWFVLFADGKVLIKGVDPQHKMSELDLPPFDDPQVREFWHTAPCDTLYSSFGFEYRDDYWQALMQPVAGSLNLLDAWFVEPQVYARQLSERAGQPVSAEAVAHLFAGKAIRPSWLKQYFPQSGWQNQAADWLQIDYPLAY